MYQIRYDINYTYTGADLGFFVRKSKFATSTMTSQAMTSFDDRMTVDFRGCTYIIFSQTILHLVIYIVTLSIQ